MQEKSPEKKQPPFSPLLYKYGVRKSPYKEPLHWMEMQQRFELEKDKEFMQNHGENEIFDLKINRFEYDKKGRLRFVSKQKRISKQKPNVKPLPDFLNRRLQIRSYVKKELRDDDPPLLNGLSDIQYPRWPNHTNHFLGAVTMRPPSPKPNPSSAARHHSPRLAPHDQKQEEEEQEDYEEPDLIADIDLDNTSLTEQEIQNIRRIRSLLLRAIDLCLEDDCEDDNDNDYDEYPILHMPAINAGTGSRSNTSNKRVRSAPSGGRRHHSQRHQEQQQLPPSPFHRHKQHISSLPQQQVPEPPPYQQQPQVVKMMQPSRPSSTGSIQLQLLQQYNNISYSSPSSSSYASSGSKRQSPLALIRSNKLHPHHHPHHVDDSNSHKVSPVAAISPVMTMAMAEQTLNGDLHDFQQQAIEEEGMVEGKRLEADFDAVTATAIATVDRVIIGDGAAILEADDDAFENKEEENREQQPTAEEQLLLDEARTKEQQRLLSLQQLLLEERKVQCRRSFEAAQALSALTAERTVRAVIRQHEAIAARYGPINAKLLRRKEHDQLRLLEQQEEKSVLIINDSRGNTTANTPMNNNRKATVTAIATITTPKQQKEQHQKANEVEIIANKQPTASSSSVAVVGSSLGGPRGLPHPLAGKGGGFGASLLNDIKNHSLRHVNKTMAVNKTAEDEQQTKMLQAQAQQQAAEEEQKRRHEGIITFQQQMVALNIPCYTLPFFTETAGESRQQQQQELLGRGRFAAVYALQLSSSSSSAENSNNDDIKIALGTIFRCASSLPQSHTGEEQVVLKVAQYSTSTLQQTSPPLTIQSEFLREVEALSALQHCPCLVRLTGYCLQPFALLLQRVTGPGDLHTFLQQQATNSEVKLSRKGALTLAKDILKGIAGIHEARYLHRDLKPHNILISFNPLDNSYGAVIADLGSAIKLPFSCRVSAVDDANSSVLLVQEVAGTSGYTAPEVLACEDSGNTHEQQRGYAYSADIFSLAVVLWEIFAHLGSNHNSSSDVHVVNPLQGLAGHEAVTAMLTGLRPSLTVIADETVRAMIGQAWVSDPVQRPIARQLLQQVTNLLLEENQTIRCII